MSIDSVGGAGHDAGMTTPRRLLIDPDNACDYHLVSRCVQRAFLCGRDPDTGRDYSHRRRWLVDRLKLLACCFGIEIYAYCIMSNHFHLVARFDPKACRLWSDDEVARRWVDAFPPIEKGKVQEERKPEARELLLGIRSVWSGRGGRPTVQPSGWRGSPCSARNSARTGPKSAWQAGPAGAGSS